MPLSPDYALSGATCSSASDEPASEDSDIDPAVFLAGITPMAFDDGPDSVLHVSLDESQQLRLAYMYGLMVANEISERAFAYSTHMVQLMSRDPVFWSYRLACVEHVAGARRAAGDAAAGDAVTRAELAFLARHAAEFPKNFQMWAYRRHLAEPIAAWEDELAVTAALIEQDGRNYHAWGHRLWVCSRTGAWEAEVVFCDALIAHTPRNNSAWHQRFVACERLGHHSDAAGLLADLEDVSAHLGRRPNSASAWDYALALWDAARRHLAPDAAADVTAQVAALATRGARSWPAAPGPLDLIVQMVLCPLDDGGDSSMAPAARSDLVLCIVCCNVLATCLDAIRRKYWRARCTVAEHALPAADTSAQPLFASELAAQLEQSQGP